jgi:hypothetical protein
MLLDYERAYYWNSFKSFDKFLDLFVMKLDPIHKPYPIFLSFINSKVTVICKTTQFMHTNCTIFHFITKDDVIGIILSYFASLWAYL